MCCFLADGFCSKGKINERHLLNAGVIIFMKEQVKFKVIKNRKKDQITKSKIWKAKVVHPRYESKAIFNNKTINFSEHDDNFRVTYTIIDFHKKIKFLKNRVEYGDDFMAQNHDLIILRFRYKGKRRIITSIEIVGHKEEGKNSPNSKKVLDETFGSLKDWKIDSQKFKDEIRKEEEE